MLENHIREKLAYAYRILADLKLDDWTYTHLSARIPGQDYFFILPFGYLFEEVTPECLLKIDFKGNILEGREAQYNKTGYVIHGEIYKSRPDLNAIFHLHTISGVAISIMECGLLPISQFALHFYDRIAYHDYNSLALQNAQGNALVLDLGDKRIMFLRNHGTLVAGATIDEAFFYTRHLENACQVQLQAMQTNQALIVPPTAICESSVKDLLEFEENLGERDWKAAVRRIQRVNPISQTQAAT